MIRNKILAMVFIILVIYSNFAFAINDKNPKYIVLSEKNFILSESDYDYCSGQDSMNDCLNEKQESKNLMSQVMEERESNIMEEEIYD